jgi:hypothetical protein
MRKNPERTAWIILLLSFSIFCLCTISIPLGIRAYLFNATNTFTTKLTSIRGTVLAEPVREEQTIPLTRGTSYDLDEFTIVYTDDTSQAVLTFFDESIVTLYNNTTLVVHQTRQPRFEISPYPAEITLEITKGRIRASAVSTNTNRIFLVRTPHAQATLNQGSYAVEVSRRQTRVTTRSGAAQVMAQDQTVTVTESELTTILDNQPPAPATTAEQNLITNGDFSQGLLNSWEATIYVPSDTLTGTQTIQINDENSRIKIDPLNMISSTLRVITAGRQIALEFNSFGSDNVHTEASVRQEINKGVQDFQSLRINAQIRLNHQSLPGGGLLGTEFPIMIQLAYRDADGNDHSWYHGFYYQSPPNNYILYNEPSWGTPNLLT